MIFQVYTKKIALKYAENGYNIVITLIIVLMLIEKRIKIYYKKKKHKTT